LEFAGYFFIFLHIEKDGQNPSFQAVKKPPAYLKNRVAGAEPPTGTRGGSPSKIPLSPGKGAGG